MLLKGVKVLDLTRILAGPYAGMMLGDLGASVIKVERPRTGDETRGWGPPFDEKGESAYFLSVNRNKLGISLDLDDLGDRNILLGLAAEADVVMDNFLPGALERKEIHPLALLHSNNSLIWCTITGFGRESLRPGFDFVIQAESGWMAINGEPDGSPMRTGVALADLIAGKDAAIAILAALVRRSKGEMPPNDRRLWISLAQSAAGALVNVAQNALVTGREGGRWGNAHPNLVPYQTFEARDRTIVIAVGSDMQWRALAGALDLASLASDPVVATNAGRLAHRQRVVSEIQAVIATDTAARWIEILERVGVPCGVVKSVLDAVREANGSPTTGIPPSVPGSVRFPPPLLNEHAEIIRRKGWGAFNG